ncbi:MAG: efflux RND transporter periplasmic adaptor subunit [Saprospiraceae bacterium]|nr:efflux RND transporter periplasmic adaptor subunit [Saprospiraceae bacterium]
MCINKYSNNYLFFATGAFVLSLLACNSNTPQGMDDDGHVHPESSNSQIMVAEEVGLTKVQIENIGLTFTALTPQNIKSTVKLSGRVELPPSGKAIAGSNLEGKVSAVHAMAGRYVQKGQKLFTIQNLDIIDWQQELKMKQSNLIYLEKELARQKELSEEEITPLKSYESAVNDKLQQEAAVEALKAKLEAIGIRPNEEIQSTFSILAPMSGIIQHLLVSNGQFVLPSTPLAEIISNHHLHLHLIAFGSDVISLEKDQILNFFVQSRPEQILKAKIMWINTLVHEQNNSYDVHAEIIDDHTNLSAGEFVEARVIDQEQELNVVPLTAVSIDKGLHYIFVKEDEHENEVHFQKLQVQIGESDLGFVEIKPIDPLPLIGDSVIVNQGSFFLLAESKKGEEGAGHEH